LLASGGEGDINTLTEAQWRRLKDLLAPYREWRKELHDNAVILFVLC
jgi:hypothetical protein